MECQASDSKKLLKVFDASKRKRSRKKREGEARPVRAVASDGSTSECQALVRGKSSLQDVMRSKTEVSAKQSDRRDGVSLALKAGLVSTPRSASPSPDDDGTFETVPQDRDSFIYAFLEEAIKRDKKKQKHARRHEDRASRGRASSPGDQVDQRDRRDQVDQRDPRDRRNQVDQRDRRDQRDQVEQRDQRDHRHHRRHDSPKEPEKLPKLTNPAPVIDQNALIESFAKLCATINTKIENPPSNDIQRSQSHKSLQCESISRQTCCNEMDKRPVKLRSLEDSQDNIPASRIRSQEDYHVRSRDNVAMSRAHRTQARGRCAYCVPYDKEDNARETYSSRLDVAGSKMHNSVEPRYREYAPRPAPTRSCLDQTYKRDPSDARGYRDHNLNREPTRDCDHRKDTDREYDPEREFNRDYEPVRDPNRKKYYDDEKQRYLNQKSSRSYDLHRDAYLDDERPHRSVRSEVQKEKRYDERRNANRNRDSLYEETEKRDKYYKEKPLAPRGLTPNMSRNFTRESREHRSKKNMERFERTSIASREDEYKEKDRLSERERDSGLSVADGESIASARSNYLRLIKQEVMEQRENMDAMMSLWKDLMRCFKSTSHASGSEKEPAAAASGARGGAATLRLWRECMRRYETVARDVGDTDARLMEEINKQRSEMAEMAGMWQECLRRYREMSNDFSSLKQKLAAPAPASPACAPAPPPSAEGEGPPAACAPPGYPPMAMPAYGGGSPVRARASAPPAWWWGEPPARRASPGDRAERDRDADQERRRHKDREREDSRYKDKSKPGAARSEHRRRKR